MSDQEMERGESPMWESLLTAYDQLDARLAELTRELEELKEQRKIIKSRMKDEVTNMGLGRGSQLNVPGLGKFHFTTQSGYNVPLEYREKFVKMLIARGDQSLLTIGKSDLSAWAQDMARTEQPLPSYITHYEDKFVPVVTLEAAKARRSKQSNAAQGDNDD